MIYNERRRFNRQIKRVFIKDEIFYSTYDKITFLKDLKLIKCHIFDISIRLL